MNRARTPDADALRFAADWLRAYDDAHDGGSGTATAATVAGWLDAQADAADERTAAREAGAPVAMLRAAMRAAARLAT